MAIKGYFFNAVESGGVYDRVYNSDDVTSYLDKIVGDGVFPNPSTNLQVMASTGMTVIVGAGQGWIQGHKIINTADKQLTIDASDVLLNRIDNVVFYVDYDERAMGIEVKKGTNASTPTAPALVRTATRYEMCLARVYVGKQVTAIQTQNITDTRGNSTLCGYVQGLIQQVDTTTLFDQWQAAFDEWFSRAKEDLSSATLLRKFSYTHTTTGSSEASFDVKGFIPQYAYEVDILEVRVNGLTLTDDEYSKDGDSITLTTPITHTGTQIEFAVFKSTDGTDALTVVEEVEALQADVADLQDQIDDLTVANSLWGGSSLTPNGVLIIPQKALSACRNGWVLEFSAYANSAASDTLIQTFYIPKKAPGGGNWTGQQVVFEVCYMIDATTGSMANCPKVFNVYNAWLEGTSYNDTPVSQNMCLRRIYEF